MSQFSRYWHFEVEINQYDVIWSKKYVVTILRVNEDEIFQCCQFNDF